MPVYSANNGNFAEGVALSFPIRASFTFIFLEPVHNGPCEKTSSCYNWSQFKCLILLEYFLSEFFALSSLKIPHFKVCVLGVPVRGAARLN